MLWVKNTEEKLATLKKHYTHGGKERSHFLISKIDDYVKHIFREHYQEADHWANLGAEGQRTIISDKGNSTERWKTVRGFWDGSSKIHGRVVIKAVDRNKWISRLHVEYIRHLGYKCSAGCIFSNLPRTRVLGFACGLWIISRIKSATHNLDMVCFCKQVK